MLLQAADNRSKYRADQLPASDLQSPTTWLQQWLGGGETASGKKVNPDTAISLSTVFMARTLIAESMAQLPFAPHLSEEIDGRTNKRVYKEHFSYSLVARRPHPLISSHNFRKVMFGWACIHDNAYAIIVRNGNAQPTEMFPIHPSRVQPEVTDSGKFVYRIDGKEILDPMSVFHIVGNTDNGLVGKSRIEIGKEGIGKALAAQEFGAQYFGKGINVSGFIKHPGKLKDGEAVDRLKSSFVRKYGGRNNAFSVGVLEEGSEFEQMETDPEKAQLNETQKVDGLMVSQLLNIPITMLNYLERGTYNNVEQLSIQFVKHTLMPWGTNWEQECWYKLLTEREKRRDDIQFKFNFNGLLRGDMATRASFYETLAKVGAYSPNRILELEDENGYDGGDIHIVSPGAQTVEQLQNSVEDLREQVENMRNGKLNGVR